ncbi:Os04g0465750, partial [Oryza sativa Japonica Group]
GGVIVLLPPPPELARRLDRQQVVAGDPREAPEPLPAAAVWVVRHAVPRRRHPRRVLFLPGAQQPAPRLPVQGVDGGDDPVLHLEVPLVVPLQVQHLVPDVARQDLVLELRTVVVHQRGQFLLVQLVVLLCSLQEFVRARDLEVRIVCGAWLC